MTLSESILDTQFQTLLQDLSRNFFILYPIRTCPLDDHWTLSEILEYS